jgi:hypothetical protein
MKDTNLEDLYRDVVFGQITSSPSLWIVSAIRHQHAADRLYQLAVHGRQKLGILQSQKHNCTLTFEEQIAFRDSFLFQESYLLYGYAIECLFKGILWGKKGGKLKQDGVMDGDLTNHDLPKFAKDCGLTLTKGEVALLKILKIQVEEGKYPGPMKKANVRVREHNFENETAKGQIDALFAKAWALAPPFQPPAKKA